MIRPTTASWLKARLWEADARAYTLVVRFRGPYVFAHYFNSYGPFRVYSKIWRVR